MKKVIGSLVAVAGLAAAANAQVNTRVDWQVSMDNVNWSTNVNAQPGNLVFVRALVSYTGTAAPLGLASLVFQPTVANYDLAGTMDVLSPFVNGGQGGNTSTPLGVVSNTADPTQFGRISPFGRSALSSTSFLKGHTHTGGSGGAPAGDWLRIAQAQITNWIGGAGNTSGGSGVGIAQLSDVGRTSNDPAFNGSIQNVQVFKFGITLGDSALTRTVDAPAAGFGNFNSTLQQREIYWWATMAESTGSIRGTALVNPATITIPTPASLALLGMGGLAITRRRRK